MAGLRFPCQVLYVEPHDCPHMTWVHDGSAIPFMWGALSSSALCQFIPAFIKRGLSPIYYLTCPLFNDLRISEKVSQSLAGRTHLLEVLPFARSDFPQDVRSEDLDTVLFYGGYPRIYKEELNPSQWLADYFATYVEKDVRSIINIENLRSFDTFLRLIGGRVGQLINFSSLSSDAGITHPTARKWLSALEASYICFILQPHYKNFNKRMTKAPKVYFYDTGLLCYLLRINNIDQLKVHPLRGAVFENWVITEYTRES